MRQTSGGPKISRHSLYKPKFEFHKGQAVQAEVLKLICWRTRHVRL